MTDPDPAMDEWLGRMSRRFPASGSPAARSAGVETDEDDASARTDSTLAELREEGSTLYEQFDGEYTSLQLAGVSERELLDVRNRFNSLYGRLENMESESELRRAISDLRNILRDVQDRNRELPAGGLAGDFDIVESLELRDRPEAAGSRADSSAEEVSEQLYEVNERAGAVFQGLDGRIPEADLENFRDRQSALVDVLNSQGDEQAFRRALTDAYDLLSDLQAREREVRRGGGGEEPGGATRHSQDPAELYQLAQRRYAQLRDLMPDQETEIENYRRQADSLYGRIERTRDQGEIDDALVDLRGLIQDLERRLRAEVRRRRG